MRILIAGGPRTGKTTLSRLLALVMGVDPRHTDNLIELGWSESSAKAAEWMLEPGPWVIEGVAVPRAIRKALAADGGCPADLVIWPGVIFEPTNKGQDAMAKGCRTVFDEVRGELKARGCLVVDYREGG